MLNKQHTTKLWKPPLRERIIDFLNENPDSTLLKIIIALGSPDRSTRKELRILVSQKIIKGKQKPGFRAKIYSLYNKV